MPELERIQPFGPGTQEYDIRDNTKLPLTGGTVSGNLAVNGVAILSAGSTVHSARGTMGAEGFIRIATIRIRSSYINSPIAFTFSRRRDSAPTSCYVLFASSSNSDPNLLSMVGHGPAIESIYIQKIETSVWGLAIKKNEPYDACDVIDFHLPPYIQGSVVVSWENIHLTDVSGWTKAAPIIADYIVDTGISGIWEYQKWKSGQLNLFYDTEYSDSSVAINVPIGNLWRSPTLYFVFPNILVPNTVFQYQVTGSHVENFSWATAFVENSQLAVVLLAPNSTAENRYRIHIGIIGTWI